MVKDPLEWLMKTPVEKKDHFIEHARCGRICYVRQMVQEDKTLLNTKNMFGRTALDAATLMGHADVVEFLLGFRDEEHNIIVYESHITDC